jgi:hypothetical protein
MYRKLLILLLLYAAGQSFADCPLDHMLIGCNEDGILGTADDNTLFIECTQKYRHSDPDDNGSATWLNWHYPLYYNSRYNRWQIGEPGFDIIKSDDPNRQLIGTADADYRIIIECVSIKSGFSARETTLGILLDQPGDSVNHSALVDKHLHLEYRALSPQGGTDLQWITYLIYDALGKYQQSEPISVVFVQDPPAGDLAIDGIVNIYDLAEFSYYWLADNGGKSNDYCERADVNKNGIVDFADFALLAANWLK